MLYAPQEGFLQPSIATKGMFLSFQKAENTANGHRWSLRTTGALWFETVQAMILVVYTSLDFTGV